jgi:hypothetical protein
MTLRAPQNVRDVIDDECAAVVCRSCGCAHAQTIESRRTPSGKIRRRRVCRNCGQRYSTIEIMA